MRIAIFAQVSSTHLDKLISWDELREMNGHSQDDHTVPRISESEYTLEERHDVFTRVQLLELSENGQYLPVEVVQNNADDIGAFQLHQGLQRRISISMTHSLTEGLPWDDLKALRIGGIHLIDSSGHIADLGSTTPDIPLKQIQEPMIRDNADGTSNITIVGQWDSSCHQRAISDTSCPLLGCHLIPTRESHDIFYRTATSNSASIICSSSVNVQILLEPNANYSFHR